MEGKIYLDGTFGEQITLESVRNSVLALGEIKVLDVDINSGGGDVDEGYAVHDYFEGLKKQGITVNTNIVGVCASIATVPFLAGEKRTDSPNSSPMIHNPWMQPNKPMEAKDFEEAGVYLRKEEDKLAKFYANKLSADVNEIKELMKVETRMDKKLSRKLGFVNASSVEYRAVASIKLNDMDKKEGLLKDIQAKLSKLVKGEDLPQAMDITLADGTVVAIDSEDGEFEGKSIERADGSPLEDGTYDLEDGRKISVADGVVTAVMEDEEGDSEEVEALKAEIEALKAAQVESINALKESEKINAEMRASIVEINESVNALKEENKVMASTTVGGKEPVKAATKTKVTNKMSDMELFLKGKLNK